MASISRSASCESFRLAAVSRMAKGIPWPSQMRCRLLPSFALSVGFGPVHCPQKLLASKTYPQPLWTTRFVNCERASQVARNGSSPKFLHVANRANVSSRSCPTTAQFLGQHLPWNSAAKYKQNAFQTGSIRYMWSSTFLASILATTVRVQFNFQKPSGMRLVGILGPLLQRIRKAGWLFHRKRGGRGMLQRPGRSGDRNCVSSRGSTIATL